MEELAEEAAETLRDEVGTDNVVGVSYYDEDGVGHVFRSEWAVGEYDPEQVDAIVEELRLEALAHGLHEEHQQQSLHATVRIYDEMLDVAVPANETHGVAFALDEAGEYSIRDVVETVEEEVVRPEASAETG